MRERRCRSGSFLCFTIAQPDDEDEAEAEAEAEAPGGLRLAPQDTRLPRRPLHRRVLSKIFRPIAFFPSLNRKERMRKGFDSSKRESAHDDDWRAESTFSPSSVSASSLSSSSSNSFSSSSRLSMAALGERTESKARPRSKTKGAAAGIFLLLSSLSMMVFCGRLSAILWTSWLLFVACGYSVSEHAMTAAGNEAEECLMSSEVRQRRLAEAAEEKKRVILKGLLARSKKV